MSSTALRRLDDGRLVWDIDGRLVPLAAGGSPEGDGGSGDGGGSGGAGSGDGGDGGAGSGTGRRQGDGGGGGSGDGGGASGGQGGGSGDGDDGGGAGDSRAAREAQELRRRLREAEQERDRLRTAAESDTERREREAREATESANTLRGQVRELALETSVSRLAGSMGVVDALAATRLLDASAVEYDDATNRPTDKSVKDALKAAIERHPFLTRSGDGDNGRKRDGKSGKSEVESFIRGRS